MAALTVGELAPYLSFVLTEVRDGVPVGDATTRVLAGVLEVIGADGDTKTVAARSTPVTAGRLHVSAARYWEERTPSWSLDAGVVDRLNHVVVVSRYRRMLAIHLSDSGAKPTVISHLRRDPARDPIAGLVVPVAAGRLNEAFVSGETRTLWLGGTHRRSRVKADSKTLSGLDLRDTLDPAADQSYYFSAARARPDGLGQDITVGVAPAKSTMWIASTAKWSEFRDLTEAVLVHLEGTNGSNDQPLPVLATPVHSLVDVADAFDVALQPPEAFTEGDGDLDAREEWEAWAYDTTFAVTGQAGSADFTATVNRRGSDLGDLSVTVDATKPERIKFTVTPTRIAARAAEPMQALVAKIERSAWVKVYYDSGHTIADQAVFTMRRRDMPFTGWQWQTFPPAIDLDCEKPDNLQTTGSPAGVALFDWVVRDWPLTQTGWLACDDGAGEIADFVHLDDTKQVPALSLIHVKAAGSAGLNRETSVSKYEIVTSQAVKNIRYLDRQINAAGLAIGVSRAVANLVWHNGQRSTRQAMVNRLNQLGANHTRHIYIVQPHQRRTRYENPQGADTKRIPLLNDLLLSTDASCRGVSATLTVVGDNT